MKAFIKRFSVWFGFLAALVGLYLGAIEVGLEWAFWVVIFGALLLGAFPSIWRSAAKVITAVRAHDSLLRQLGVAEKRLDIEIEKSREIEQGVSSAYDLGVEEGMLRVIGSIVAFELDQPPNLAGISEDSGKLSLMARCESGTRPLEGARFELHFVETGDLVGVVQVERHDRETGQVVLTCIERTKPRFWEHLEERMDINQSPPAGIVVTPYIYQSPIDPDPLREFGEDLMEDDLDGN